MHSSPFSVVSGSALVSSSLVFLESIVHSSHTFGVTWLYCAASLLWGGFLSALSGGAGGHTGHVAFLQAQRVLESHPYATESQMLEDYLKYIGLGSDTLGFKSCFYYLLSL